MKKITLQRDVEVPDTGFCIMWKNQQEVCPELLIRKDPKNEKSIWVCTFFEKDLKANINSYGIMKFCEESALSEGVHHVDFN